MRRQFLKEIEVEARLLRKWETIGLASGDPARFELQIPTASKSQQSGD